MNAKTTKWLGWLLLAGTFLLAWTYLFVTAPPPLEAEAQAGTEIPVERGLALLNRINAAARKVWTRDIVQAGKAVGFKFSEDWEKEDVEAGPLPALFLRETAKAMQRHRDPVILFLGSDYPINPANRFDETQASHMRQIRESGQPAFFAQTVGGKPLRVGMFPDRAVAKACVACHNAHPSSPKKDWRLGDIMGATTWMYAGDRMPVSELWRQIAILEASIRAAYEKYLDKAEGFRQPPEIGACWPESGKRCLPDADAFMARVRKLWAPDIALEMETLHKKEETS